MKEIIIIGVLLIAVVIYGIYDCRKIDKRLDNNIKWFEKKYGKHNLKNDENKNA